MTAGVRPTCVDYMCLRLIASIQMHNKRGWLLVPGNCQGKEPIYNSNMFLSAQPKVVSIQAPGRICQWPFLEEAHEVTYRQ